MKLFRMSLIWALSLSMGTFAIYGWAQSEPAPPPQKIVTTERTELQHLSGDRGLPTLTVVVTSHVSTADLKLATEAGMAELQNRVRAAAVEVCTQLQKRGGRDRDEEVACLKRTYEQAMARTTRLLARTN
jgi:hypothetical protein